jgi:hypothetical protein
MKDPKMFGRVTAGAHQYLRCRRAVDHRGESRKSVSGKGGHFRWRLAVPQGLHRSALVL